MTQTWTLEVNTFTEDRKAFKRRSIRIGQAVLSVKNTESVYIYPSLRKIAVYPHREVTTMTKQHFEALAHALHAAKPSNEITHPYLTIELITWQRCCERVADVCGVFNQQFDCAKFLGACEQGVVSSRIMHHPGTDRVGHPLSECATRGCSRR